MPSEKTYTAAQVADWLRDRANQIGAERYRMLSQHGHVVRLDPDDVLREAADEFLTTPPTTPAPLGPNAGRPEHGTLNAADARAHHEHLAARGERDES